MSADSSMHTISNARYQSMLLGARTLKADL